MHTVIDRRHLPLLAAAGGYLAMLATITVVGAAVFRDLYSGAPAGSDALPAAYRRYLALAGAAAALCLGLLSAAAGARLGQLRAGLAALALGGMATLAAFLLLPWVHFPHDRYAAPAAWIMGPAPLALAAWIGAAAIIFVRSKRGVEVRPRER